MVIKYEVEGFDAFIKQLDKIKAAHPNKSIIAMFSGSKLASTGKSWCPDCVAAQPVVDSITEKISDDFIYVYCSVGERDVWKDKNCIFRTDSRLKLKCVPTLLKMGTPQRLEEEQCANPNLVEMMFEE